MTLSLDTNDEDQSEAKLLKKIMMETCDKVEKLSKQLSDLKQKVIFIQFFIFF